MMKTTIQEISLSILAVGVAAMAAARADDIPQRMDFSRYDAMLQRSPFRIATVTAAPVAAPNAFKDLYVANAAHTDQFDLVTVVSASDKNFREYLTTEKPNEHGYSIANIQWSEQKGQTKVTISKDGQFGTIGFNEALMNQPAASAPVPSAQTAPVPTPFPAAVPAQQANVPKPPQYPAVATPVPHTRPVIQRNPRSAPGPHAPIPPPNTPQAPSED